MLLRFALGGDKAHARRMQRSQDRFGIACVGLDALALAIGLDEFGSHDARYEPEYEHGARPVVGTAAGFHRDRRTRRQTAQPGQEGVAFERDEHATMAVRITSTNGKYVLCQAHCGCRSIRLDFRFRTQIECHNPILALRCRCGSRHRRLRKVSF